MTTSFEGLLKRFMDLGLNSYDAKVYIALLSGGEMTASKLAGATGIPRPRIYDVLGNLMRLGLVVEIPKRVKTFRASDPKEALLNMLYLKHQAYMRELEEKRALARKIAQEIYRTVGNVEEGGWRGEGVEIYSSPGQILKRYQSLIFQAEKEVLVFSRLPYLQEMTDMTYELSSTGVSTHFLVSEDFVKHARPGIEAIFRIYGRWEHRMSKNLPLKGGIFDSKRVILIIKNGLKGEVQGVVIHDDGVAFAIRETFWKLWQNSVPITPDVLM